MLYSGNEIPSYNINDLTTITDKNGNFSDLILKSQNPIITDYSRINREIVEQNNTIFLGKLKDKKIITNIQELRITISNIILQIYSYNSILSSNAWNNLSLDMQSLYVEELNPDLREITQVIVDQITYDILYDKYCRASPRYTLYGYCRSYYDYNSEQFDILIKQMKAEIKREFNILNASVLREDAVKLGVDPDMYLTYFSRLNKPGKKDFTRPKILWDYIYYNGCHDLITSMQYKRNFKRDSNNSYERFIDDFNNYDIFVNKFMRIKEDKSYDYFCGSMDYYHLEIYKRLDFIYKLAVIMEQENVTSIDKENYLVKRYHPIVFYPSECNNCLKYNEIYKYYRPFFFMKKLYCKKELFDNEKNYMDSLGYYLIRAKAYESFNYHYKFMSDDYDDISNFIRKDFNVLEYHEINKEWIYEDNRYNKTRIANVIMINNALFGERKNITTEQSNELEPLA